MIKAKKHNIFRKPFPLATLIELLNTICPFNEDYYLVDMNVFQSMVFLHTHRDFYNSLQDFYYPCQQFYVTRPIDYRSFTTVLRQLCNYHHISFRIDRQYNHSTLITRYFIDKPRGT